MAGTKIFKNPALLNKTLKTQREMYKRQAEGMKSEVAKRDAKQLGLSPAASKETIEKLRSDVLLDIESTIATLDHQKINNIATSGALSIFKGGGVQRPSRLPENPELLMFYDEMNSRALSTLTGKQSSGLEMMWNTIDIADELSYSFNNKANTFSNYADVQESYRYFKSGQHGLTVFDLETFGGKNKYGQQEVDMITEYTFDFFDSTAPGASKERIAGFVGLSKEAAEEYTKEFQNYSGVGSLTTKQKVIADSLAKIGHADTSINEDLSKKGRFLVEQYGNSADTALTKDSIMAGIKEARRIGQIQEQSKNADGLMVWEEDMATAILKLQNGTSTVAGHNITRADIPWMNQMLAQQSSPAMKDYLSNQGFGGQINIPSNRILDTLPILQMADVNPKTMGEIWPDNLAGKILKGEGLTPFQQEGLARRFFPEMFESTNVGAHAASFDVEALHKIITEAKLGEDKFFDRVMELAGEVSQETGVSSTLKGNQQQLFYSKKSIGGGFNKESIFGFKVDSFNGHLKTMDGVEMAEGLSAQKSLPEYLTKKGMSYTIDTIDGLKPTQEYIDKMKKVNPSLAVNELVAMKISPVVNTDEMSPYSDLVQKSLEPSYIFGPKEDVKSLFANNMILFGEKDESGQYQAVEGAKELLGKQVFSSDENGVKLVATESTDFIKDVIQDGTFVNVNDSAARSMRDNKRTRYEALSRFSETINKMAEEDTADLSQVEKKKLAIQKLIDNSREVSDATASGQAHTLGSQAGSVAMLQDILGYKDRATNKQTVHPRTIDNAVASLEHFESIADEINLLLSEVNHRAEGASQAERNYLFSEGLDAIRAKSLEKLEASNADMIDGYVRGFEKDYFEVDINQLLKEKKGTALPKVIEDVNQEGVLKIDLKPGGEHRLIRSLVGDETKKFNQTPEAMKRLGIFADTLQKEEGLLEGLYGNSKQEFMKNNTPQTFARKIIHSLQETREADPTAGYLNINKVHSVQGASEYAGVLSQDEILNTLEERFSTFRPGMIMDISKEHTKEAVQSRRTQASSIVDNFLMASFDEKALSGYGYNPEQISKLKMARDVRRKDYVNYVDDLLAGISRTDMDLIVDEKRNVFGLVGQEGFIDLKNVPRERFTDGIFYTQVGRNRVATELHLTAGETASDIGLKSGLAVAIDEEGWNLERSVENAIRKGDDPEKRIQQWISSVAGSLREGSSITMFDEQDMKSQFEFFENGVVDALPTMSGLRDLGLEKEAEFLDMISKKNFSFEKMNDTQKQLWALNREKVMHHVGKQSQDESIQDIVKNISSRGKSSAADIGRIRFDPVMSELEHFNRSARDIENQVRYLAFREDYARDTLKELGMDKKVDLGAHLRTNLGHSLATRTYEGTDERAYTEFVADRIALTGVSFKEKLVQAKRATVNEKELAAIDSLMIRGNLTEGGAIGSARIADAVMQNFDRQKISYSKELFTDHENNMERFEAIDRMRRVIPTAIIGEDGTIQFEYKSGVHVRRGDKLFDLKGYGGSISPVGAKYEGALQFGYFSKGQGLLANENEVIDNVKALAEERGIEIDNQETFMSLAEEAYDANFFVDRLSVEPYRKTMEDRVEKHMTAYAYYGLGDSDDRITSALTGMGLNDLSGKVLDKRYLDELADGEEIGNGLLADMSKLGHLDSTVFNKAITDAGFQDADEFRQALMDERYMPSDVMENILGAPMAMIGEDISHQNRNAPIMTAVNTMLGQETNAVMEQQGLSREEAVQVAASNLLPEIQDAFVKDGQGALTLNEDGKFVLPEIGFYGDDYIDTGVLREAYDNRFGEGEFITMLDSGNITRHSYAIQQDFTGRSGSGILRRPELYKRSDGSIGISPLAEEDQIRNSMARGAKITDREINMMESIRFDQTLVDRMSSELSPEDFENAFGHAVNTVDGQHVLKDEFENTPILGDFTNEIRRNQFAKPGEALVTPELAPAHLRDTVEAIGNVSGGNVGLNTAESLQAAGRNIRAMQFNEGKVSLSTIQNEGFEVIPLSEIDRVTGEDATALVDGSGQSLMGRNVVIDMQDDVITPDIISATDRNSRYLALGELPVRRAGDDIVQYDPHHTINSLITSRNQLADTSMLTDGEIQRQKDNIVDAANRFNQEINTTVFGKTGLLRNLSETRLERSTFGKASLMDFQDILDDGFANVLDNVEIDGKSIINHHRANTLMDFKIMSREQFEEMGIFDKDYLEEVGMSAEQVEAQLRSGVSGFSHRSPTIYEGSVRPTTLILSDDIHGNQAVEYAAGALSSHMDADGDAPRTWLASFTGSDGNVVDSIQYNALRDGGVVDEGIERAFTNQKAMMYRNATSVNRYFSNKVADDMAELDAIDSRVADKLVALNSTSPSGRMYPGLDRKATPEELSAFTEKYNALQDIAVDEVLSDTPSLRALSNDDARLQAAEFLSNSEEQRTAYMERALEQVDPLEQEEYSKALSFNLANVQDKATEMSKQKRASAGEMNLPMYRVNKLRNMSSDVLNSDEHQLMTHLTESIEEAFLSPKHADGKIVDNALTMSEFNRALRSVAGNPMKGDTTGTDLLEGWFEQNLPGRFKFDRFDSMFDSEEETYHAGAKMFKKILGNKEMSGELDMFTNAVGAYRTGIQTSKLNDALLYPAESQDMLAQTYRALEESGFGTKAKSTKRRAIYEGAEEAGKAINRLDSGWTPPTDKGIKATSQSIIGSARQALANSNITGKDLAFGALGIAGAVMVAGFVGGNPSQPATTQASEQQAQDMYTIPSMSDEAMSVSQGQGGGGYVININANSKRGRKHVEEAIQQAMAQNYNSTNVNVSMNIRDNAGNITDRNIESLIRGSF